MERRHFLFGLTGCALCAGRALASEGWSYRGGTGPEHWGEVDSHNLPCSAGNQQSPIDISGEVSAELPKLAFAWKPGTGTLVNTGHTIQVNVPAGSTLKRGDDVYELVQFHFHTPSEHHVNNEAFSMEAHFVHKDPETGAYGVVAVFLSAGKAHETFAALASVFPATEGAEVPVEDIDPATLLPQTLDYWLYEGSLTTPPCSESVDWMVLMQPVEVAPADIARFAAIYSANARPIHSRNRRFVLSSR